MPSRGFGVLALVLGSALLVSAPASASAQTCAPVWRRVPSPNPSSQSFLRGAAGTDGHDVWAVGHERDDVSYLDLTLTEHWDGSSWTIVPSPNAGTGTGILRSVAALSTNDVWAVGSSYDPQNIDDEDTFALHWDGVAWSVVPTPHPGALSELRGVWGAAHDDVWAVGEYSANQATNFLVEHWNGSVWSLVPAPALSSYDELRSVSGTAGNDVWAVGHTEAETVAVHWDGSSWSQVPTPTPGYFNDGLYDVDARTSDDVWAVGYSESENAVYFWSKWHWDGVSWTTEPNGPQLSWVYPAAVAGLSGGSVWSVGNWGINNPAVDHWDGSEWSRVAGPVVPFGELYDTVAVAGDVWTVGYASDGNGGNLTYVSRVCPVSVADGGFSPNRANASIGSRVFWSVGPGSSQQHSITDGSGMGLFDSGLLPAGASFDFVLVSGGTYTVVDQGSASTSTVAISVTRSPQYGGVSTTFHVQYASVSAQPGFAYDVQIKRPGQADFVDWKVGQIVDEADFLPDAGQGVYSFRSRLRSTGNGTFSGWSPPVSITVS
jgi:hypothetical protein